MGENTEKGSRTMLLSVLLLGALLVLAFNFMQQSGISSSLERQSALISLIGNGGTANAAALAGSGALDTSGWTENEIMNYEMHGTIPARAQGSAAASGANTANTTANFADVSPKGVPSVYGAELGVAYDDVSANDAQKANATIEKLAAFDRESSGKFISLSGDALQRYINIASQISCEYCCGAQSIIFSNGQAACGCAHSYSMRGLAKYLLTNHASEFTDDQILEELGKWKTLYFPGALAQKAAVLKQKGIEFNYINLASNKYRGIEKEASGTSGGSMVGGC